MSEIYIIINEWQDSASDTPDVELFSIYYTDYEQAHRALTALGAQKGAEVRIDQSEFSAPHVPEDGLDYDIYYIAEFTRG